MEFINKLSTEELQEVLNKCGLFVVDDLKKVKADTDKEVGDCYYIRAIDTLDGKGAEGRELDYKVRKNFLQLEGFEDMLGGIYSSQDYPDMYTVSDFLLMRTIPMERYFGRYPQERDYDLQEQYVKVMGERFKDLGYKDAYNAFAQKIRDMEEESQM